MFWSGNYIAVRELNFLLKEENVSLSQVLEAEDILQECKAHNKALIQFLTRPEILAELVTLITEEPPQHVDLLSQYRHASIACEVLTSQLSTLSDHLSMDTVQMHRLCDFINREPPLNPLLASYFSKTIEMLLERNPQQDWYQYHIMCLRVLDFFKSRRDFLPNLLRHLSTSAIADTFKSFIRIGDLCHKNVTEWLEENQFLECLIQIICGTYVPEPLGPPVAPSLTGGAQPPGAKPREQPEKADTEDNEKTANHKDEDSSEDEIRVNNNISHEADTSDASSTEGRPKSTSASVVSNSGPEHSREGAFLPNASDEAEHKEKLRRMQAVASANAASLLCDIILTGCATEGCNNRHTRTSYELVMVLQREECVRGILAGVFTAPSQHANTALLHGCRLLLALLHHTAAICEGNETQRCSVEVAAAPHLPLLHQALIRPNSHQNEGSGEGETDGKSGPYVVSGGVGAARLCAAALLAHLAKSEAQEVATTMMTLGTPGAVIEMVFRYPDNNLLHAHALALLRNALDNTAYRTQYARHLLVECDLLTRLMDAFEENEAKKCSPSNPRAAYMGHVILMLSSISVALHPAHYDLAERLPLPPALLARWRDFHDNTLRPLLHTHDTPLGGSYPSENVYDVENMDSTEPATYDFSDMQTAEIDDLDDLNQMCTMPGGGEAVEAAATEEQATKYKELLNQVLSVTEQYCREPDMWDDSADPEDISRAVEEIYCSVSPWDSSDKSPNTTQEESRSGIAAEGQAGGEACGAAEGEGEAGWATFDAFCDAPVDPFTGEKVDTAQARADEAAWAAADRLDQAEQWQHAAFSPFWPEGTTAQETPLIASDESTKELEQNLMEMTLEPNQPLAEASIELANNLLTAMSSMAPDDIANIVNANLPPPGEATSISDNVNLDSKVESKTEALTDVEAAMTKTVKEGGLLPDTEKQVSVEELTGKIEIMPSEKAVLETRTPESSIKENLSSESVANTESSEKSAKDTMETVTPVSVTSEVTPKVSVTETSTSESMASDTPSSQSLGSETQASQSIASETPASQSIASETPALQSMISETPASQSITSETPASASSDSVDISYMES